MVDLRQAARGSEALESVDQLVTLVAPAHHHRRQLPVTLQRFRHGAFGFRHMQAIAPVMLADLLGFELQQILAGPAQHPRRSFRSTGRM
jgi:hypothetical protein